MLIHINIQIKGYLQRELLYLCNVLVERQYKKIPPIKTVRLKMRNSVNNWNFLLDQRKVKNHAKDLL